MMKSGRPVDWDGAVNAWHVAGGVYRMGRREWLTEAGWQQAYDDGIRTVVDLRNAAEARRRDSDPVVPGQAWSAMTVVSAPTEEAGHPDFTALCGPYLNDPAHYGDNARLFPAMIQDLAGYSDQDIADGYRRGARGINERHRTHGPPHAGERYIDDDEFAALLEVRGDAVVRFVRSLDTRAFLLRNGLTREELDAVLLLCGAGVAR